MISVAYEADEKESKIFVADGESKISGAAEAYVEEQFCKISPQRSGLEMKI